MDYDEKRATAIKIAEIIRDWTDEHELETSPGMEIELSNQIFNKVILKIINKNEQKGS